MINLQYYEGEDKYSGGSAECRILQYIVDNEPEQYSDVFEKDDEWAVFYHLTQIRKNLLNWYGFKPTSALLEIGAGMGALTSLFCERCGHVTAVEMSKRKATAIQARCRRYKNLEIMAGDFTRMQFGRKYDYITVIGVLEYQSVYGSGDTPQLDFMKALKKLLAPGGKIIVAIENKLGLKYWSGEVEDHTGIPFDSINDYAYPGTQEKARTFDKQELSSLLFDAGFVKQKFYYPLPDYKLPRSIYTNDYMPSLDLQAYPRTTHYPDASKRVTPIVIDEHKIREPIIRNGVFPFFANSFLVECAADNIVFDDTLFAVTDGNRVDKYRITTRFDGERFYKYAASPKALPHIKRCFDIASELNERGVPMVPHQYDMDILSTPMIQHKAVEQLFIQLLRKRDIDGAKELLDRLYDFILRSSEVADSREGFSWQNDLPPEHKCLDFGVILKKAYFDLNMFNCLYLFSHIKHKIWKFTVEKDF